MTAGPSFQFVAFTLPQIYGGITFIPLLFFGGFTLTRSFNFFLILSLAQIVWEKQKMRPTELPLGGKLQIHKHYAFFSLIYFFDGGR